jgi:plastocyanin
MRDRRTYLRSVATITATAAVAGCSGNGDGADGGDGGDGQDGSDGGETTSTETPVTTPTETAASTPTATQTDTVGTTAGGGAGQSEYPDYNWDQLDGVEATDATTVTISGFAYDPIVARVPAGTTVSFPNEDSAPHTVTAPALGVDKQVGGGAETSVTVEEPGTYDYVCRFHPPDMLGRLVVEES